MCWFSTVHIQSILVVCFVVIKTLESKANALESGLCLTFRVSLVPGMPNSQLTNGTVPFFLSRVLLVSDKEKSLLCLSFLNSTFLLLVVSSQYSRNLHNSALGNLTILPELGSVVPHFMLASAVFCSQLIWLIAI